jgi:hypothetical protein
MPKIPERFKYLLTSLCTVVVIFAVVWWAFRPPGWRPYLRSILERAFTSLTSFYGANGPGWILSVFVTTIGASILTLVLMFLVRGRQAMRDGAIGTAVIAILCIVGEVSVVWGPLYLRHVATVTVEDHQGLLRSNESLADRNRELSQPKPQIDLGTNGKEVQRLKDELAEYRKAQSPNVRTFPVSRDIRPGTPKMEYVLTTGVIRANVDLDVNCDFHILEVMIMPMTTSGGSSGTFDGRQLSLTRYRASMLSPAWGPSTPLWVTVLFAPPVDHMPNCSIAPE